MQKTKTKLNETRASKSWIVDFWSRVFKILSYISTFLLVRKLAPKLTKGYSFVEYYVTFNTVLSFVLLFVVTYRREYSENLLLLTVMIYGFVRTFEIIVYQINVLLFDEFRANQIGIEYAVRGYRRLVLLLIHNYIEIVCWFGVSYMWFYRCGDISIVPGSTEPNFLYIFHESLLLMFSFSPDQYVAKSSVGLTVFTVQAIIGLFMTLVVFARFLGLLPVPKTMDEFEDPNKS